MRSVVARLSRAARGLQAPLRHLVLDLRHWSGEVPYLWWCSLRGTARNTEDVVKLQAFSKASLKLGLNSCLLCRAAAKLRRAAGFSPVWQRRGTGVRRG